MGAYFSAWILLGLLTLRRRSQYGELIKTYIKEGLIVPMEVTIKLLENAMTAVCTLSCLHSASPDRPRATGLQNRKQALPYRWLP